jgi:FKBP-type peptidyl-prolyl cis-trans isomerase SlyD
MMGARVQDGKVVVVHYTMRDGETVIESTKGKDPVAYLHGRKQMLPGLERALDQQEAGAQFTVTLEPEETYGKRTGRGAQAVPRKEFPRKMTIAVGMPLEIRDSEDRPVRVWITKVQGSKVWIDIDHPMAGKTLTFDVEVVLVRDPLPEELEHGHTHGAHGTERH